MMAVAIEAYDRGVKSELCNFDRQSRVSLTRQVTSSANFPRTPDVITHQKSSNAAKDVKEV